MMRLILIAAALGAAGSFADQRSAMVDRIRQGVRSGAPAADDLELERALAVMRQTPREAFVPKEARPYAYADAPLPIGYDQTISGPYAVALMTASARLPKDADVLDVGTGSGYQAAVLAPLVKNVASIEIVAPLAREAAKRLHRLGYRNVEVRAGDGFAGWPERAPFDAIIVAAGAAAVPQPLLGQLKPGGRLVMPIGPGPFQEQLLIVSKMADGAVTRCSLGFTAFVPLTGRGQRPETMRGLADRSIPLCWGKPVI